MYNKVKIIPSGDNALVMEFGNRISPEINNKIRNMVKILDREEIPEIIEIIPTYRSILIIYNPMDIDYGEFIEKLKGLAGGLDKSESSQFRIVQLPTVYGGEYGPDLGFVAEHNKLSLEEIIKIHSSRDYLVYMLGFTPGFAYLGGMDERIETPRLQIPRTKIPAGSTGIAGKQTGIYPIDSPGGWQLIGRTPVKLYNPLEESPVLLNAGDYVRFVPVDEEEYLSILELVSKGKYQVNIIKGGEGHDLD